MPELAEVAYYCSRWNPGCGERILEARLNGRIRCFRNTEPTRLAALLEGNRMIDSRTHGKRILFRFDKRLWLSIHLGMTGSLSIRASKANLKKHDHIVLNTSIGWLVYNDPRQFGVIESFEADQLPEFWQNLPPEPISKTFDLRYFRRLARRGSRKPLKSYLLDQTRFPGVGNWMADEILWQSRIRPQRAVDSLDDEETRKLFQSVKRVSRIAMERIAPDFSDPPKTWLFHRRWRTGELCPKTGDLLKREKIGGKTTCWSEYWQR